MGRPLIVSVSGDGGHNEVVDGVMQSGNPGSPGGPTPMQLYGELGEVAAGKQCAGRDRTRALTATLTERSPATPPWRRSSCRYRVELAEGPARWCQAGSSFSVFSAACRCPVWWSPCCSGLSSSSSNSVEAHRCGSSLSRCPQYAANASNGSGCCAPRSRIWVSAEDPPVCPALPRQAFLGPCSAVVVRGGWVTVAHRSCQTGCHGQSRGRCRTRRPAVVAIRAGPGGGYGRRQRR